VFELLRGAAYFARLRADAKAGTIVWPNDADIPRGAVLRTRSSTPPPRLSAL
jgi:hypothetical protein